MQTWLIAKPEDMLRLGGRWARQLPFGAVLFLEGELGAGKTTLARGLIAGLGYRGAVTSPTYTIMESYAVANGDALHLDLYRLNDANELEMIGLRDMLDTAAVLLVEWPARAPNALPAPNFRVEIKYHPFGRRVCLHTEATETSPPAATLC